MSKNKEFENLLAKFFTSGQIKKIMHPEKKNIKWSSEDIAGAISLCSVSSKSYRYLKSHGFPLPALSTLRKWAANVSMKEGILEDIITLMKTKSTELKEIDRLCILSFEEICVK